MTTNIKLMVVLGKLSHSFQDPLRKNLEELKINIKQLEDQLKNLKLLL